MAQEGESYSSDGVPAAGIRASRSSARSHRPKNKGENHAIICHSADGCGRAGLLASLAATASAQVDHEKCYKIKDPIKLQGIVDLTTPQFGLEPGCKIGKAKYFCAPASKTVISATDKATGLPIIPLPVYAPDAPVDRICYKVKCPVPPPPFPPDQNVTDQFGNRTLTKFKASYVCTPAVTGPAFCGNGVIDAGEDCDGATLGACTVGCRANCTCSCETACCYVEQPPLPRPSRHPTPSASNTAATRRRWRPSLGAAPTQDRQLVCRAVLRRPSW